MKFEESLIAKKILKTIPSIKRKIEHIKTIKNAPGSFHSPLMLPLPNIYPCCA